METLTHYLKDRISNNMLLKLPAHSLVIVIPVKKIQLFLVKNLEDKGSESEEVH